MYTNLPNVLMPLPQINEGTGFRVSVNAVQQVCHSAQNHFTFKVQVHLQVHIEPTVQGYLPNN